MSDWWLLTIPALMWLKAAVDTRNHARGRGWRSKR